MVERESCTLSRAIDSQNCPSLWQENLMKTGARSVMVYSDSRVLGSHTVTGMKCVLPAAQ